MEIDSLFPLQSYPLALLTLVGNQYVQNGANEDHAPFGMAMRLDTRRRKYRQTAHRLLRTLIEHAPSPEAVAREFLNELANCENPAVESLGDAVSILCDTFYVIAGKYILCASWQSNRRTPRSLCQSE